MKSRGFTGIASLAKALGLHRNSLQRYMGGEPVLPQSVTKLLDCLDLTPGEALRKVEASGAFDTARLSPLIDALQVAQPKACYVMFGSRARGTNRRYSDVDLGVFCAEGFSLDAYLSLLGIKETFEDELPVFVDLVNLNNADGEFLSSIGGEIKLLAGRNSDWLELKMRCSNDRARKVA